MIQALTAFTDCLLRPKLTILWTTHGSRAAVDRFHMLAGIATLPKYSSHVRRVIHSAGDQRIEFGNGSRIIFRSWSAWHGSGFSNVDTLVLDEAELLTDDMEDGLAAMQCGVASPETIRISSRDD